MFVVYMVGVMMWYVYDMCCVLYCGVCALGSVCDVFVFGAGASACGVCSVNCAVCALSMCV